jgi:hypothetical protein
MKKLAWTALVMAVSGVASRIAVRALNRMWRSVTKSDPPPTPRWAQLLVGKTTKVATATTKVAAAATPS